MFLVAAAAPAESAAPASSGLVATVAFAFYQIRRCLVLEVLEHGVAGVERLQSPGHRDRLAPSQCGLATSTQREGDDNGTDQHRRGDGGRNGELVA